MQVYLLFLQVDFKKQFLKTTISHPENIIA